MSTNLVNEATAREVERQRNEWGDLGYEGTPGVRRMVAAIVADVLDLLSQDGRMVAATPIPPGPCWHDSGVTWPDGWNPRCELLAGHEGAHEVTRPNGGSAVWLETTPTQAHATTEPDGDAAADESGAGA